MVGRLTDLDSMESLPFLPQVRSTQDDSLEMELLLEPIVLSGSNEISLATPSPVHPSKAEIRSSLTASIWDGVFATLFTSIVSGVLINNLLVELNANPMQLGMLSSIPMLANLIQPLGAYLANQTSSRRLYGFWIYGCARLLWLPLAIGLGYVSWTQSDPHVLITWTLLTVIATYFLGALGSASWLSWVAALVPRQLRGRFFGTRNSATSLISLISVPLLGFALSLCPGGMLQGYGMILLLGVIAGLISLGFQWSMVDMDPQDQRLAKFAASRKKSAANSLDSEFSSFWQDRNFLVFLVYLVLWMFAVNVSAPFFNIYLLDTLNLDLKWVTLYNSLTAGANLLMLIFWGRLADRIGNRVILLLVGLLVAITPVLWLGISADFWDLWLWIPLLQILAGGTWAAIDLCSNNIQLEIAPVRNHAGYFAMAAAVAGVSGAMGTTVGGLLAQFTSGGFLGLFVVSSALRLLALVPLIFVNEQRGRSVRQLFSKLFPWKYNPAISQPAIRIELEPNQSTGRRMGIDRFI